MDRGTHFEGFCIDLLKAIAEMIGFDYQIALVPDGKYGVYNLDTGEWNGIVRQLMDKVNYFKFKLKTYRRKKESSAQNFTLRRRSR